MEQLDLIKVRRTTLLKGAPIVVPVAEMMIVPQGLEAMAEWVRSRAPACLPEEYDLTAPESRWGALFPHDTRAEDGRPLTSNELLVELAGRKCYNSFGLKAGRKSNREYIANTQAGDVPHASIMYHAKMSFFIAGVSRRVSHELIRHYVGADRTEDGSPSQESTRYVEHPGFYVVPPGDLHDPEELSLFAGDMARNYTAYRDFIDRCVATHKSRTSEAPKGMVWKRILERASARLSHTVETSFIWTTNPIALQKMFKERDHDAADLEYRRFAQTWKAVCLERWPNLFLGS